MGRWEKLADSGPTANRVVTNSATGDGDCDESGIEFTRGGQDSVGTDGMAHRPFGRPFASIEVHPGMRMIAMPFSLQCQARLPPKESVMSTVPTDSVLRRHYEQMQEAARLVPTDSVLRRHYEQMQEAARSSVAAVAAPEPAAPAAPEPPAASRPAAAPEPAPSPPPSAPAAPGQGGGFLGWLKRLFGG